MQHERDIDDGGDLLEPSDIDARLANIHAVNRADGHGQSIDVRFPHEFERLIGRGIDLRSIFLVRIRALGDPAEFGFHADLCGMSHFHGLGGIGEIFGERQSRAVVHHRRKADIDGFLDDIERLAMIEVQDDRNRRILGHAAH